MMTIETAEVVVRPRKVASTEGQRVGGLPGPLLLLGTYALMVLTFVRGLFWVVAFPLKLLEVAYTVAF
jgi:hypothetical protein